MFWFSEDTPYEPQSIRTQVNEAQGTSPLPWVRRSAVLSQMFGFPFARRQEKEEEEIEVRSVRSANLFAFFPLSPVQNLEQLEALCKNPVLARRTATIRAITLCDCRVTYRDSLLKAGMTEAVKTRLGGSKLVGLRRF